MSITKQDIERVRQEIEAWRKDFGHYVKGMQMQSYCPDCEGCRSQILNLSERVKELQELSDKRDQQIETMKREVDTLIHEGRLLREENERLRNDQEHESSLPQRFKDAPLMTPEDAGRMLGEELGRLTHERSCNDPTMRHLYDLAAEANLVCACYSISLYNHTTSCDQEGSLERPTP